MVDFAKLIGWREPVEIYLAAMGNPEPLATRIKENEPFTELERRTMVHFLRGELKPPKRKRGQKRLPYLTTIEDVHENIIREAVLNYHHIMSEIEKEHGSKYRLKFEVIEYIANRDGLDFDALLNRINRPKEDKNTSRYDGVPHAVKGFHKWLHRTGQLEGYPRYVSSVTIDTALLKELRRLEREDFEGKANDPPK